MSRSHIKKDYLVLVAWICGLMAVGWVLGFVTKSSVETWYLTLNRSPLTPPDFVFGITWSVLYAMIATSGWLIWRTKPFAGLPTIKKLYIAQLVLNWSWTPLFFTCHLTGVALICLTAILALVVTLVMKTYKPLTTASFLLIPYTLWLSFAGYLNFYIWQAN